MADRVLMGIDGNAGFALLGPDLQEGEADFVVINKDDGPRAAEIACNKAYAALGKRLGKSSGAINEQWAPYQLDPSHPRYFHG
jgi:hypothetical protein